MKLPKRPESVAPCLAVVCLLIAVVASSGKECQADDKSGSEKNVWASWRGPHHNGSAASDADPPIHWDSTKNIQWVADLPGQGTATPIVWGDQVFVVSARETSRRAETPTVTDEASKTIPPEVYFQFLVTCLDRKTGKTVWQQQAAEQVPHEGHHPTHTYAAASPTTDGQRLFVSFGSRGLFCYSMDGKLQWQKDLGDMRTRFGWGEAVTPTLAGDRLIVNWDQEQDSFIAALDVTTGDVLWKTPRPGEVTSWNTPLVTDWNGQQIAIVNGTGRARAYDVQTGAEIWSCGGQTVNAIPSPLRYEDFVVCMSGYRSAAAFAIPLASAGDITDGGKTLWQYDQGTPYVPSPSLSGHRLIFTAANNALLTCLDVRSGKPLVDRRRLQGISSLYASPLVAGGHVYLVGREGATVVLKDDDKLEQVAINRLDGTFDASPVAVGTQLFLRSWTQLFCISEMAN